MAIEDDGSVAALVCDNGSGMVKVGERRASALSNRALSTTQQKPALAADAVS